LRLALKTGSWWIDSAECKIPSSALAHAFDEPGPAASAPAETAAPIII
jgi:hypothetical protein